MAGVVGRCRLRAIAARRKRKGTGKALPETWYLKGENGNVVPERWYRKRGSGKVTPEMFRRRPAGGKAFPDVVPERSAENLLLKARFPVSAGGASDLDTGPGAVRRAVSAGL